MFRSCLISIAKWDHFLAVLIMVLSQMNSRLNVRKAGTPRCISERSRADTEHRWMRGATTRARKGHGIRVEVICTKKTMNQLNLHTMNERATLRDERAKYARSPWIGSERLLSSIAFVAQRHSSPRITKDDSKRRRKKDGIDCMLTHRSES